VALFCLGIILLCRSAPRTNSSTPRHAEWDYPGWWVLSRIKPHRRNLRSFGQLMNPTWSWVITQCSTALELTGCFISLLGDCLIWLGTYHHPCLVLQKEYCLYMTESEGEQKSHPRVFHFKLWSRTSSPHLFWHCPVVKNGNSKWRASSVLKFRSEPDQFQRNAAFGVSEPGVNNCPRTFVSLFICSISSEPHW